MVQVEPDRLVLADWRRLISELYAEVRHIAARDPASAHQLWRTEREALYRSHEASPVPESKRAEFHAVHFPYDQRLRFELPLQRESAVRAASPSGLPALPVSVGQPLRFEKIGHVDVAFPAGPRRLAVFWLPEYSGGIFLPFRDGTNGSGTYGGGRYLLDTAKGADLGASGDGERLVIDFNFAYQPSCAFDPRWSCPLSPAENSMDLRVHGGERIA